jgi:hypothetical protein
VYGPLSLSRYGWLGVARRTCLSVTRLAMKTGSSSDVQNPYRNMPYNDAMSTDESARCGSPYACTCAHTTGGRTHEWLHSRVGVGRTGSKYTRAWYRVTMPMRSFGVPLM